MANTEGMPDEFVESLATAGSTVYSHREEQRLRARLRQKRLQDRMNLPPGGSPAAKIIRPSRNNRGKANVREAAPMEETPPSSSEQTADASVPNGLPLIGEIIEHKTPNRGQPRKNETARKASRFAAHNRKHNHATGFPSVHDVPIGTFVKNKKKKKGQERNNNPAKPPTPIKSQAGLENSPIGSTGTGSHDQMKEASQRDSEAMLAGMTREEIENHQQDIQQALSSDMIAFLKNRRKQKTRNKNKQPTVPNVDMAINTDTSVDATKSASAEDGNKVCSVDVNHQSTTHIHEDSVKENITIENANMQDQGGDVERKEKERIAKLVSSIRTHEDLDATYRAEMNGNIFGTDFENVDGNQNGNNKKEAFLVACDLLRSSSARQTLWASKTITSELECLVTAGRQDGGDKAREGENLSAEANQQVIAIDEIPSILSVSLRCLLDKPLNSSSNYLLHTYALQSLYYLVTIYAHPDHDMLCDNSSLRAGSGIRMYQEDYMDDAVPSPSLDTAYPPMSIQPLAVDDKAGTNSAAAYMTSSTTSSALADGEDFKKDPMWTLLSKMKIIPRLAFLLESQQHLLTIPTEGLTAICGIISMIGQRSPGAASAIVQHKTLTSLLLKRMMQQIQQGYNETEMNDGADCNRHRIILATIRLFCILSRQSRFVAQSLPLEDILPPLLAAGIASSHEQFLVQQHALFLWRTSLRYGLGTEALASMLTISAQHMALPYSNKYSLSSDFLSSFTLVIECVRVIWSKNINASSITISARGREESLIERVAKIVESATMMMASTLQTVVPKNSPSQDDLNNNNNPDTSKSLALRYRWNASRLLFVSAWFQLFDSKPNGKTDKPIEDYIPLHRQEALLLTIEAWAEPKGELERAWRLLPKWCDSSLGFLDLSDQDMETMEKEATACAFVNAYFTIALVVLRSKSSNLRIEEIKRSLHKKINAMVIEGLKSMLETLAVASVSTSSSTESRSSLGSAREKWINQCQFAVAKFCFHSISMGLIGTSSEMLLVRSLVFALLGRLGKGDESIAAVLFSSDVLFQRSGDPAQSEEKTIDSAASSSSPISSMFLGELCGSEVARKQLDHSFKLQHGFGITSAGFGPFQLDSLLSSAEIPNAPPSAANDGPSDESSFPLGRLWLWQCLSGSIRMRDDLVASGTQEAANVVAAVLELILDLEETEEINDTIGCAGQLPIGSKLYYLVNVCLHHEHVLRDERVLNSGEILLDRYLRNFGHTDDDIAVFCQECLGHSGFSPKSATKVADEKDDDALGAIDEKVLDQFSNALIIDLKDSKISSEQIRAMIAFLEDLAAAYRDYGAQYDFFTKCIRVLLLPMFPSLIRCRGLRELDKMLHLLTVSNEIDDETEMRALLSKSLTGGLPAVDDSLRDDTEFLNAVSKAVTAASPRPLEGYMRHYCTGVLVRNFATSLTTGNGVEISKKRLKRLNAKTVHSVCEATDRFLQSPRATKGALVEAVMSSSSYNSNHLDNDTTEEQYVVQCLDSCIARNLNQSIAPG